tara:strand:+ start:2153 stop:2788 length:636 start_codon:yes stop_codon:yes gene_type:complete
MGQTLLIFGGKSTAIEIRELVITHYPNVYKKVLLVRSDNELIKDKFDYITTKDLSEFIRINKCKYIVGFSNHNGRIKTQQEMLSAKVQPVNVIHPSSTISKSAIIGLGNYIAAGSIISTNAKICDNCIINYHVSIGHDAVINNNSIILPGSRISGCVTLGQRVLIGANSFIFKGISIGNDCIIDAMTHVIKDIEDSFICSSRTFKKYKRIK